jgi:hypothetical protein
MIFSPQRIVHATTEQEIDAALETADQVIVEGDDRLLSYAVNKAAADPETKIKIEIGETKTQTGHTSKRTGVIRTGVILLPLFGFLGIGVLGFLGVHETITPAFDPPGPPRGPPAPSSDSSDSSDTLTLVSMLIWPVVTIVAIITLFLIARQSIGQGRNVEITWKVTEKVQGKVVISKVQARRNRQRATATV